ncbi:PLDc_N domain-containing protein [Cryobacterium algoritolerans]|uniref:PLDc_N domain-containing protein n=1 Tax=Cryobacterium algoritolerans TaxID=1259184 RepID=A0A4R8WKE0_9MICO|nr:PLDc N-terminal domain-containing protein [Cryobacterium algoritolerans]TFC09453.1 PLDc_N domain-containing protein [Cryobacterium algoritolerans]
MAKKRWSDLSGTQRAATMVGSAAQFALAAAAWSDLANRPAKLVNGKKAVWAVIIAVNFAGPISYFLLGRRGRR